MKRKVWGGGTKKSRFIEKRTEGFLSVWKYNGWLKPFHVDGPCLFSFSFYKFTNTHPDTRNLENKSISNKNVVGPDVIC